MSDGNLLIKSLAIILLIGVVFTGIVGSFSSEDDLENTWVAEAGIDDVFGAGIDIFKYSISSITWLAEGVGSLFGIGEQATITINGTGEHDTGTFLGNYSLDGDYDFRENYNPNGVDEVYENSIRTSIISSEVAQIRVNKSSNTTVEKAWIISDSYGRDYEDRIYESADPTSLNWYSEWNLVNTNLTFNDKAYGEGFYLEEIDTSVTEKVRNFFDDKVKSNVKDGVKSFGLLPEVIGIPIFVLLVVAVIYAIIKLFPWT